MTVRAKQGVSRLHFGVSALRQLKCKRSFELPFSWLFAIIAGVIILLLAIYATSRLISVGTYATQSEAGKQIAILLNPVVNGITSAYATKIDLKRETRLTFGCYTENSKSYFGKQVISFAEESGLGKKWQESGANISIYNKFIFSDKLEQGKKIYIFSKPFYTGFRVDDLIFLSMENYCFVAAPEKIKNEVIGLNMKNINISSSLESCQKNSAKVCFDFQEDACNVSVYGTCGDFDCEDQYEAGYVIKNGKQMNYFKSLIYAAIFSSPENYECNINRLGKKIGELAAIYKDKADMVRLKGCDSVIGVYLDQLISSSDKLNSAKLENVYNKAKLMDEQNCDANCKIYTAENC